MTIQEQFNKLKFKKEKFELAYNELKKQVESEEQENIPATYWYINHRGEKVCEVFEYKNQYIHYNYNKRKAIGNVFLTESSCKKKILELKQKVLENNN